MSLSNDEQAGLSEAEIAALEADDDIDDADDNDVAGDDNTGDADTTDVADGAEPDANLEADVETSTDQTAKVDPPQAQDATTRYKFDAPEDAAAQIEQIETDLKALGSKLDEGEIELKDYHSQLIELTDKRADIKAEVKQAQMAESMNEQAAQQSWAMAQQEFFRENSEYSDSPVKNAALDAAVRELAQSDDSANQSFSWLLHEAKNKVEAAFGKPQTANQNESPPKPAKQKTAAIDIPPTLGGLPASGANDTGKGDFDYLDNLDGMELESALNKLSSAQVSAYLEG